MKKYVGFDEKRYFPLLRRTKTCRLSPHEMLAYSYLVHRGHFGAGASLAELHRFTSLDRDRTLPQIRDRLAELGLIEIRDGKLFALQPTGQISQWFHRRKAKTEDWHDQLQFIRFYPLSDAGRERLTLTQCCILWLLYSLASGKTPVLIAEHLSQKGMATLLGINRKTVAEGVKVLNELGLIDILPSKRRKAFFAVALRPPTPEHLDLFMDAGSSEDEYGIKEYLASAEQHGDNTAETRKKKPAKTRRFSETWDPFSEEFRSREPEVAAKVPLLVDLNAELMRQANYSESQIIDYWKLVGGETRKTQDPLGAFCLAIGDFEKFFKVIQKMHDKNLRSGNVKYAQNSYGLLKTRMPQRIKGLASNFNCTNDWATLLYTMGAMAKV